MSGSRQKRGEGTPRDTSWVIAAEVAKAELHVLAERYFDRERGTGAWLLAQGARWEVLGSGDLSALVVDMGRADENFAREVAKRLETKVFLLDFDDRDFIRVVDDVKTKWLRGHPVTFLAQRGIAAPGCGLRTGPVRAAVVIENASAEAVRPFVRGPNVLFSPHPRGTLLTGHLIFDDEKCARRLDTTVYRVVYDCRDGSILCLVERKGSPTQRFSSVRAGSTRPETEEIADVLGESTAEGIARALALPDNFLSRDR